MNTFLSYISTLIVFLIGDAIWLGFVAKNFYSQNLKNLLANEVNWYAAIIFYCLFVVAVMVFAVIPAVEKKSVFQAAILGAFFGFITYATYDLTNLATLKDWPLKVVVVDIVWGSFLTSIVAVAGFYIYNYFN